MRNPFSEKKGSTQRRIAWQEIADASMLAGIKMKINERIVRDRFNLLKEKFKQQMNQERRGSGITCEYGELEHLIQDVIDMERDCENDIEKQKKNKEEEDKEKAKATRKRCLERIDGERRVKKSKMDMDDRLVFFKERNEIMMKDKEEERKIKKEELELRKEELSLQKELVKNQQKQSEAQQQSFQNTILQMQAQQTELLKLLLQRNEK